jgi:hypothetical protein
MSISHFSTTESLILRNGIFAVGGLIVDMDTPGIGLWNHTLPADAPNGAVWSEDVLWLEPVSACVDTNLTVDYTLHDIGSINDAKTFNITDRGGFFNLTPDYPSFIPDGQNVNLGWHAYRGAVLSNFFTMESFNVTRNESYSGRTFPTTSTETLFTAGSMKMHDLLYVSDRKGTNDTIPDIQVSCIGYGGLDTANISNVAVHCDLMLAPPERTGGGDPRLPADNSTWTQRMFGCATVTRARMQRVTFSFNGTMDLTALSISRSNIDAPVLWATEKSEINIGDIDLFWGRVPDSLEGDPSLWTIRSDIFYIPAGASDLGRTAASGQPSTLPAQAWGTIEGLESDPFGSGSAAMDYSGLSNRALLNKFQSLLTDSENGPSQIHNLIWTDFMTNNVLGTDSRSSLLVKKNVPSVAYDLRYAVPALLLLSLWVPLFAGAAFVFATGLLKFSHLRHLLNHTGAGRVALGNSALKPVYFDARYPVALGIGTVPYTVRTVQIRTVNCGFRALTGRLRYGSRRRNKPYDCVYGRRQRWRRKVSEIQNSGFHLFLPPLVCLQPLFPSYQPGW